MAEDRISQLPDDILQLILDKIGIFQAVETSILSKRWKNPWRSLPALRFHFLFSLPEGCCRSPFEEMASQIRSNRQRVSQFLSHRDAAAAIHDFHLSFGGHIILGGGVDMAFVEECVVYAINHGVQSLRLHWPTFSVPRLPVAFPACKTLRELELINCCFHSMEPFPDLPEMEKLTLMNTYSVAPVVIKAPKLRVLKIYGHYVVKEIYAPLLTSFTYKSPDVWECAEANLPMLEQVYLDIHKRKHCRDQNHSNFLSMLHQLRNATTVSLTSDTSKVHFSISSY